jgi:hypothetical protein
MTSSRIEPATFRFVASRETNIRTCQEFPLPRFNGTRKFITMFTTDRVWFLPWARWNQFTSSVDVFNNNFNIILMFTFSAPKYFFPLVLPTEIMHVLLIFPMCATFPAQPVLHVFDHRKNVWWKIVKFLIVQLLTASYNFLALTRKYSRQRCVLRQPQSTFLIQCVRPSFTPTQN